MNLTEQEVGDLMNFLNDLPTKYGMPLVAFFNAKLQEQEVEQNQIKEEPEPDTTE